MLIIGCDYHPSVQQIAMVDTETGDYSEHRVKHSDGEAEKFYRDLKLRAVKVRVGLEATGHRRWFERLLMELEFEVWIGDAAQIAAMRVRKQKTDRQDAQFLLKLMMEDRFPRVWMSSLEDRDLQQLLWHRHRVVQMVRLVHPHRHYLYLNVTATYQFTLTNPGTLYAFTWTAAQFSSVPEPGTLVFATLGLAGVVAGLRGRRTLLRSIA
jgi:transposase